MNTRPCFRTALLGAGLLVTTAGAAASQVAPNARALGMGGAYIATARGHETLFVNPANLGLRGTPYWSVAIPQINIHGGSSGPTLGEAWDIIQSSGATAERREELLALVPGAGLGLDLDVRAPLVVIQNRHLVLGVAYGAVVDHSVGRDLVELFVDGYQAGRTDYAVGNTSGSRATYFDFALGYGRRIGPISVGATAHYLRGRTLSRMQLFEPVIDPAAESIEIEYHEVLARGGQGYGVDLGVAFEPTARLALSAAVSNAFGRMTWSEDLTTRGMTITQHDFGSNTMHWETRINDFRRAEAPLDPAAVSLTAYETAQGLYDDAFFPATLRAGASYHLPVTRTHVEASYQSHLTSGRLGGGWGRVVSAGIQQKIPLITLRAGVASNLEDGSLLSGGVTLGAMEIGLARMRDGSPDDALRRQGWIGAVGLNIGTTTTMR